MSRLLALLDRFWFAEAPAARLAWLRILVGAYVLFVLLFRYNDILATARLPQSYFEPVGVASILSAPIPPTVVHASLILAIAANVAFILGLAYRVVGPLFAGVLLWVLSYQSSWGSVYHADTLATVHVLILGVAPAADALSLDSLIRSRRRAVAGGVSGWQYGLPIRLVCTVTVLTYFLAGVAKVAGPFGWAWGTGEVLRTQVAFDALRKELLGLPPPALPFMLHDQLWLFAILAAPSLLSELGAPLVLLHPRLGYAWAISAFLMHWGIYFVMAISFRYYLFGVAYASFFPLERLGDLRVPARPRALSVQAWLGGLLGRIGSWRPVPLGRPSPAVSQGLLAALALLVGVGAVALAIGLRGGRLPSFGPRPEASAPPTPEACPAPCRPYQVVWVGDILLGDGAQRYLDQHGYAWPFEHVRPLLEADFVIGNAEGPVTSRRQRYFADQRWHYNARPEAARALAEVGFDALGLGNNHALDRGPEGLADTLRHLREAGIQPFGAGMDDAEAAAPLLIQTPHGTVGVLAFGEAWSYGAVAGPGQPGTVPFDDEAIVRQRDLARAAGARWVVAYVHWGENYEPIKPRQRRLAAAFARAGYDLVVGHHSHVAQEVDIVGRMPVLYSLGNFAFGSSGRFSEQFPGYGLVARTYLGAEGFEGIELTCIVTDNEIVSYQSRPCDEAQARTLMQELGRFVSWQNGRGFVSWPAARS